MMKEKSIVDDIDRSVYDISRGIRRKTISAR